jgi:hypothetical protein
MRETGDEVEGYFVDPGGAKVGDVAQGDVASVQAADRACLQIDEGLHAERDAIHAGAEKDLQYFRRESAGGDFYGDLSVFEHGEVLTNGAEECSQLVRGENAWSASAQVDGIEFTFEDASHLASYLFGPGKFNFEMPNVLVEERTREYP